MRFWKWVAKIFGGRKTVSIYDEVEMYIWSLGRMTPEWPDDFKLPEEIKRMILPRNVDDLHVEDNPNLKWDKS